MLSTVLRLNHTMTELDVSCNAGIGPEGCDALRRAVEQCPTLTRVDMRQCGGSIDAEFAVAEALRVRLEKLGLNRG